MVDRDLSHLERYWHCKLTTVGRVSGERRRVTIWFALGSGRVYLTGSSSVPHWCRNIRSNGRVTLEIAGEKLTGTAHVVDDPEEAGSIRRRFVDRYLLARLSRPFGGYTGSVPVVVEID